MPLYRLLVLLWVVCKAGICCWRDYLVTASLLVQAPPMTVEQPVWSPSSCLEGGTLRAQLAAGTVLLTLMTMRLCCLMGS